MNGVAQARPCTDAAYIAARRPRRRGEAIDGHDRVDTLLTTSTTASSTRAGAADQHFARRAMWR